MNTIKGDLIDLAIEGKFDLIVHGCNCFNTMGKGIAKSIRQNFPARRLEPILNPVAKRHKVMDEDVDLLTPARAVSTRAQYVDEQQHEVCDQ